MKNKFFTNSEEDSNINVIPRCTPNGFEVVKCPKSIFGVIMDLYKILLQSPIEEEYIPKDGGVQNYSNILNFEKYMGIIAHIHQNLLPLHESWAKTTLIPSAIWGVRSYIEGSVLTPHKDRPTTHHISSIIMVDKDLNGKSDWPLTIQGYDGKLHKIYTDPGDIILYESVACMHGRPEKFEGNYFRNFYMHYQIRDVEYVGMENRESEAPYGAYGIKYN
jgi:hypothetical protein